MADQNSSRTNSDNRYTPPSIASFSEKAQALYEQVLCPDRFNEILPFLNCLPLSISDFWGYELRLHDKEAAVDFLVCIGHHHAAALCESLSNGSLQHFHWHHLLYFAQLWKDPQHPFHKRIKNIWLEMDAAEMQKQQPVHNLFYGPEPMLPHKESLELGKELLSIFGVRLSSSIWQKFSFCQHSLPSHAKITQVGVMLARDKDSLRFFAQGMNPNELAAYLTEIGWKQDLRPLQALLGDLGPYVSAWGLNVELNETGMRNAIGIECYLPHGDTPKLEGLIDVYLKAGLLSPPFQTPLHDYAKGCNHLTHEKYIEFLHHFKISIGPNAAMAGKTYLGIKRNPLFFMQTLHRLAGSQ